MINTWFTSDTHFGHTKILEYEKESRPFSTVEEMNECLIDRWNSCVRSNDIIYHLGDFCFGKSHLAIAERLNGKKRLIMGNHDHYPIADYVRHFEKIMGVSYWKMCVLSHVPVHPSSLGSRAFLNVHGHLHSNNVKDINGQIDLSFYNVSVEQNNLYPVHADNIKDRMKIIDEHP